MEHSHEENKPKQEHIAAIFKEYTTPSRVLRSFTNLSNTVIQTALSGQSKFLFEILQNADDAFEDQHKEIEVQFILQDNYLIVHHNGKGFDFNDVERICDYASQIEEVKSTDLSKTGYKGLGFKSLFNLSDCIYIYSNGYSFRFDKTYGIDPENKPWQVIPIWCEYDELPLHKKYSYNQPVNFILKLKDVNQLESQLRELVDQPELLLYLYRINKLSVNLHGEKHSLERKVEKFGSFNRIDFYKNQYVASTWLSITYKRSVPTKVQTFIQGASRFIYPNKIKKAKEVPFTFALRSDETLKEISKIKGFCYSTLPTQLHLTLPYHINSFFILNLDRTQLHENEWNEFLIYQIGCLQLNLLKDLAEVNYLKNYVIELFVRKINHPYATFSKAFLKGFTEAKGKISWLPAHQGPRLLKLGEAWTDEIEFFKQNFQKIRDHKIYPYLINYNVKSQNYLSSSEGEAKHFTYDQLFRDFPSKYYPQLTRGAYIDFVDYLYKRSTSKLKNIPFLRAKDGTLLSPKNALLEENENPIPDFLMLNPIDNDYLPLNNTDLIKDWLALLGARRLTTSIQIIRESILKWINSGEFELRITIKNHIEIINYLAKSIEQLTKKETDKLKEKLLILTESNQFKRVGLCYLPDAVSIKELSIIISDDEKISSSYDMNNLKKFFIHVGVHDRINPIDVLRKSILMWIENGEINAKLTIENYKPIIEFAALHYPRLEDNLTESEKKALKNMPVLTCGQIFQKAQVCYFDSAIPSIKGLEGVIAKNKLVFIKDIPNSDSVCKFLTKIGVSKKIAPVDVIRRSILMWIKEGKITNRINKDNHQGILKYISAAGLNSKEKKYLRKMPILTEAGIFREAYGCYWSTDCDSYEEIPGLKSIISSDEIVYSGYEKVIKNLLEELGVRKLTFIEIYEKYSEHLTHPENVNWFFYQLVNYWKKNKASANDNELLNYLQQKFNASSCLLGKNDKTYYSKELYSSRFDSISDIDPNSIPLLAYEKLPEELEKWLGFKTDLDLKCITQLLKAIEKNPKLGEEKTRIFFTTLLEQLRKKDKNEIRKCPLSLFSKDNKLTHAKDLHYFIEENATCYLDLNYLKRIAGMSHDDTLELAKLCGVNTLPLQQEFKQEEETYDNSLKVFYLERLPFIVVQESKKLNEEVTVTLRRLYNMISTIKLYQCQSIYVKYPFDGTIDGTKIPLRFDELTVYVTGEWGKRRSTIHDYLKKKLGLKTDIRDIIDMESISQNDKQEWLSEQNEEPKEFYFVEEELKKLLPSEEKIKLDILAPVASVKSTQPHHSEYEKDSKLLVNEEELTAAESSSDESSVDSVEGEPYLQAQYAIKAEGSGVHSRFIDDPEAITRYETATVSIGEDIIEVDTRLVSSELEIDRKKRIQQSEISGSYYLSTESLHTGSSKFFQEATSSKQSDIKWLSEKYVFIFLQDHYKNKYLNSQFNLSDGIFTLRWQSHKIEIEWLNASEEKGRPYDFLLKKDDKIKRVIEVKSTNSLANNDSFNISRRKFIKKINQLATELPDHKEKYCIYRVLNTDNLSTSSVDEINSSAALYKVVPLKNL